MTKSGFFSSFDDVWMLDGVRTPMVDYCGALGHISPTDLGIKADEKIADDEPPATVLERAGIAYEDRDGLYTCKNPFRPDNHPSFDIYGEEYERWGDFASGEAGDVLERVEEHGDLFEPVVALEQDLPEL